jgi:hypothetical protein
MYEGLDKNSAQIILNYLNEQNIPFGSFSQPPKKLKNVIDPDLTGIKAGSKKVISTDILGNPFEEDEGYDPYSGESTQSQILRGREQMPKGYEINYQTSWANVSKQLNNLIQSAGLSGGLIGTVIKPTVEKQIKDKLARMYLGFDNEEDDKNLDASGKLTKAAVDSVLSTLEQISPLGTVIRGTQGPKFGILGDITREQLGEITAMGIDPLEWAMNRFGAQKTAANVTRLPGRKEQQTLSQGGYLGRAKAKGII